MNLVLKHFHTYMYIHIQRHLNMLKLCVMVTTYWWIIVRKIEIKFSPLLNLYQFWSQLNSTLWGMCSRLVHLRIRKCKHFLNWLVFVKKEPKLFPTDKTLNKYEVLSVVLYKNYEYKNRTMNNAFLITYNNCRTPQLQIYLKIWKKY